VGDPSLRLKIGSGRDDSNSKQFWISRLGHHSGGEVLLPNGRKELGVLFFSRDIAWAVRTGYSSVRQFTAGWAVGGIIMEWTAPAFEEVCLNCEINSYASAKL
jgi:coenzyme PQQ precursor peptide PqqA